MATLYPSIRHDLFHYGRGFSSASHTEYDNSMTVYSGVGTKQQWSDGLCTVRKRIATGELIIEIDSGAGFVEVHSMVLTGTQYRCGSSGNEFVTDDWNGASYDNIESHNDEGQVNSNFREGITNCKYVIDEWTGVAWSNIFEAS